MKVLVVILFAALVGICTILSGYSRGGVLEKQLNREAQAILASDLRFSKVQARYEQLNAFLSGLVESEHARAELLKRFQDQVPGGKVYFQVEVAKPAVTEMPVIPAASPVESQPVMQPAPPAPTFETIEFAPTPVTSTVAPSSGEAVLVVDLGEVMPLATLDFSALAPEPITLTAMAAPPVEEPRAPAPAPIETFSIYFGTDESFIAPEELTKLDALMERLREPEEKRGKLLMMGFADYRGTFDHNHALSLERARSVRDALVEAGAPVEGLRFAGFGESQAASSGEDSDLQKDRRVDFVLMPNDFQPR